MNPLGFGDPLRLGPYRLVGVLGEGGMGKVYLAAGRDGRPAAVKVLRPELAHDQDLARRFVREAHTARAVESPGVARVLGAEVEGGRPWIATEFLSGPTLEEAVARHGPLDEPAVRLLAAALAGTLRDVHAAGLVHRDVKPANIVLTADGPRLIDFGIARPEHGLTLTTTGQIPVTPGYGAPEQVLGRRVTGAADVFSLGAVLVLAASGRRAYDGPHVAAVQYAVVHEQPDLGGLPPALHPLVAPCFRPDPAQRPTPGQIAGAFAPEGTGGRKAREVWRRGPLHEEAKAREAEVRRLTAATVVPGPGDAGVPAPSRRRFLALGAGGGLLLAGGGGTAWWLTGRDRAEPPAAGDAPDAALLEGGRGGVRPKPLWGPLEVAASGPLPTPVVLRDVVVFAARDGGLTALRVVDGSAKWTRPELSPRAGQVAVNEDEFACADASGRLSVRNASTGAESWSVADAGVALLLAATPEGVYFLTSERRLRAVDTAGRRIRWTVESGEDPVGTATPLAAAGPGRLAVSGTGGDLTVLDTADGRVAWRVRGKSSGPLGPAIEGDTLYAGGEALTAFALADGERRWEEKGYGDWGPPALDPEGLTVTGGGLAYRYRKDGSRTELWIVSLTSPYPSRQRPVVQGDWIWVVEGNHTEAGVSALSRSAKDRLWSYERENPGPWAVAAAGNRVFLLSRGRIVAMPTA
ncbi:protein kinase domain-containing protein [Streptomyces omiyaensis]|uniref:Protein kinase n=1 Tax=Streptomyces omiyaensis TaxID=68247 RepID=A0ABW7BLP6_9ACTN|nr:serine/threonine-protein kinase [Streptomyces omiyaensis]GGY28825.1 hypothetical protein GCM10010363_06370 [Streptomyces omiyaensis]